MFPAIAAVDAGALEGAADARFLMCPPRHFAVSYSINPWMDPVAWSGGGAALARMAERQWTAFRAMLLAEGARIECLEPKPHLPDLVFTANAAVVLDGKALLARFRHPERQREEQVFRAVFEALQERAEVSAVVRMPDDVWLEGAGDCIWDRKRCHFWMGFGPRSHREAARVVADVFGVECVPLELANPVYYHLDTAFCPLPSGELIYYPRAFTPKARHLIEERVAPEKLVAIETEDAARFAANAVAVNGCIVLSGCSDGMKARLEERGITVVVTPLHAFLRSGGSACCLTLRLDHRSNGFQPA
jgi:N-dimethylarginine dimethylaminohydrolase